MLRAVIQRRMRFFLPALLPLILFAQPTPALIVIGALFVGVGVTIRMWAAGHIAKSESVAGSGPYSLVRHPLYAGTLFCVVGWCVISGGAFVGAMVLAYTSLLYLLTIQWEERWMTFGFPEQYAEYQRRVPCLIPNLRSVFAAIRSSSFDINRALQNREIVSALWTVAMTAAVAWR